MGPERGLGLQPGDQGPHPGVMPSVPHDDGVGEFNVPQLGLLICEVGASRGVGLGLPWWSSGYESPHNAGVVGSILGQRTKILHVTQQLSRHAIMKTQHNPKKKKAWIYLRRGACGTDKTLPCACGVR